MQTIQISSRQTRCLAEILAGRSQILADGSIEKRI